MCLLLRFIFIVEDLLEASLSSIAEGYMALQDLVEDSTESAFFGLIDGHPSAANKAIMGTMTT